ncbi:MAG: hypothetical protein WCK00_18405 [Deltaproteobacteria bacterium]
MKEFLEYAGALVIGGMVFLMLIGVFTSIQREAVAGTIKSAVQSDFSGATEALEYDFRKIGYGVADSMTVAVADSCLVSFKADIDDLGIVDSVTYWLDPAPDALSANPRTHVLYRKKNAGAPTFFAHGVTDFRLSYFDQGGSLTTIPRNIRFMRVALAIEGSTQVNEIYPGVCWERTFRPKNLR